MHKKRGEKYSAKKQLQTRKNKDKKPAHKNILVSEYKFYLQGGKTGESLADPDHGCDWKNGEITCTLCGNKYIS